MVILSVVAMLIMLTIMATQLSDASVALELQQRNVAAREVHYQMARSGVELAMQLINADSTTTDSAQDLWALGSQAVTWEGKKMVLEIRDEDSRFPLTMVTNTTTANTTATAANTTATATSANSTTSNSTTMLYTTALQSLLTRAGLPAAQAVAALQDWTDADQEVRPGGAEQGSYPNVRVKNGPLDSLEELQYILYWGAPTLPPPAPLSSGQLTVEEQQSLNNTVASTQPSGPASGASGSWAPVSGGSDWSDWLTLWSGGKVNVNTAPAEVLRCLDPSMTDTIVAELIATRAQKVLKSQQDLQSVSGIDADLAFRLSKLVGYNSQYFRIRIAVDEPPARISLEVVVNRSQSHQMTVVSWRVN
jgi:type II secretory pathway component PulK